MYGPGNGPPHRNEMMGQQQQQHPGVPPMWAGGPPNHGPGTPAMLAQQNTGRTSTGGHSSPHTPNSRNGTPLQRTSQSSTPNAEQRPPSDGSGENGGGGAPTPINNMNTDIGVKAEG
jgi:hypothetical protein